ncbi:MAG TPA: hypothetical protein VHJ20_20245 [Polyangia bacterium]|nr:hypothetical protein [Polyangia bacterium]
MRRIVTLILGAVLSFAAVSASAHGVVRYMSQHPLPRRAGGGFCYIDVPHVHDFGPSDPRMYRQVDGQYYFVGDPSPFEYQGPRYAYYGAHPVVEANVSFGQPVYCYLQGPHYHWYQPPPQATFELRGGAYWYTGSYEPAYYDQRPHYAAVNEAYAPMAYDRPIVDVALVPAGFHGELVGGGPGWRAHAVIGAPMAPPPPPVQVQVGVGINMGGPVMVGGGPAPVYVERHDHGHHEGWRNNGWREPPPPHGNWRGAPPPPHGNWRGAPPPPSGGGWRGAPPANHGGGWRGAPPKAAHGGGWKR